MEPTSPTPQGPQSPTPGSTSSGLEPNIAAALSYFWIPAIIFLAMEPYNKNRFVRFHSFQSLVVGGVWMVGSFVLSLIPILGWILLLFLPFAALALFIICVIKAYQNAWFKLPIIGDWAEGEAKKV